MSSIDLRPLTIADEGELYEEVDHSRIHLKNLKWTQTATVETVHDYIVSTNASADRLWGIFVDGHPHGCITLRDKGDYDEIGYWLGCDYRDRGVMTEAVRQVLEFDPKREVRARIMHMNIASRKILRKSGFELYNHDDMWYFYHLER